MKIAIINFLKDISESPAAIFTAKAGVKGSAMIRTRPEKVMESNFFFIFVTCLVFFLDRNLSNFSLKNFLKIKKEIKHPMLVDNQDKIYPKTYPKDAPLSAIKTLNGKNGKIDSNTIKTIPDIGPK